MNGGIPPELGNLHGLQELALSDNHLSGAIPPELGSLLNLRELALSDNRLSGEIPPELGELSNLRHLRLAGNSLSRCVPDVLFNVPNNDLDEVGVPFGDAALAQSLAESADRTALLALYCATNGTNWADDTNWLSEAPLGDWHGVTTNESGRVRSAVALQQSVERRDSS